ncbi:MAG: hypothetical protein ACM31C_28405 [Acidobacteriota bacterium]
MTKHHLLLALALTSATAFADSKPTDPKLVQLVGHWEGGGTFTLQGTKHTYKISYGCQRASVGPGIACTALAVGKDLRYEEDHLFGYDKATDTYHLFSVNDWGEAYDHASKWSDAGKVTFQFDGSHAGKPVREVYTYEFKSANEIAFHGRFTSDGKVIGDGEYTLNRAP